MSEASIVKANAKAVLEALRKHAFDEASITFIPVTEEAEQKSGGFGKALFAVFMDLMGKGAAAVPETTVNLSKDNIEAISIVESQAYTAVDTRLRLPMGDETEAKVKGILEIGNLKLSAATPNWEPNKHDLVVSCAAMLEVGELRNHTQLRGTDDPFADAKKLDVQAVDTLAQKFLAEANVKVPKPPLT